MAYIANGLLQSGTAAVDAKRGKIFSVISKEISLATRDGGKDPEFNPRLQTLIIKQSRPICQLTTLIVPLKKGLRTWSNDRRTSYEGYTGEVGLIVEVTTDNKTGLRRSRSTFSKGGNLAER